MAVNTAIPDAASGSHRSSQTRRDASTTSKGAGRSAITWKGTGLDGSRSGALARRIGDDTVGFEGVESRHG